MDIQNLIRLAHQADLEGNFRVADKLTERAIREAANRLKQFYQNQGRNFGNTSNRSIMNDLMDTATEGTADAVTKNRNKRQRAGDSFKEFVSREKDIPAPTIPAAEKPYMDAIKRKRRSGQPLTQQEIEYETRINAQSAKAKATADAKAKATANAEGGNATATGGNVGDVTATGGAGGAGGAGGNATSGSASQANNANNVGVGVRNDITTQNQNIMGGASSYSGGNTMTVNNKMPSNWPGVLAGAAAAGGAGYLGYLIGKDGRPVAPAPNAKPGDFKANQLSERAQAHQMGNAQGAQNFIEARRGNPQFQTAQDFYYAAQSAGMSQSDMNQIAALAKAEGFRDKTPLRN
jgi:hypothetical protein